MTLHNTQTLRYLITGPQIKVTGCVISLPSSNFLQINHDTKFLYRDSIRSQSHPWKEIETYHFLLQDCFMIWNEWGQSDRFDLYQLAIFSLSIWSQVQGLCNPYASSCMVNKVPGLYLPRKTCLLNCLKTGHLFKWTQLVVLRSSPSFA